MKKLNWGCGSIQPEGWVNVDHSSEFYNLPEPINQCYVDTKGFPDNEFDIIVAHASVQQVEWNKLVDQLREFRRLLKPGGVIRISLPDIEVGFAEYQRGNINWFPNSEQSLDDRFSAWLTWYSTTTTLLTRKALLNKLAEAGFIRFDTVGYKRIAFGPPEITELDTRANEFFFVEAVK